MNQALTGQVEDLRILRDGFGKATVLHGSASERATVVGTVLGLDVGDTIEAKGRWDTHPKYGRQFKAREIRAVIPADASGAIALLSRLPGIGRKRAAELVKLWPPPEIWEVLERRPEVLEQVSGITRQTALRAADEYRRRAHDREEREAFYRFGLTDYQVGLLKEAFGAGALAAVREDPYQLVEAVPGFGFRRADQVARGAGLPVGHPSRIRAALVHCLRDARGQGHARVHVGVLVRAAAFVTALPENTVGPHVGALEGEERVTRRGPQIYLPALAWAEERAAKHLLRLVRRTG